MASNLSVFLAELKRRKVYQVAAVYVVVGFTVASVAQYIFDMLGFPLAAARFVAILIILGLPVALVLAWAYEVRPEEPPVIAGDPASVSEILEGDSRQSIAVLPFANMSDEAENEYFSDGMTEEIINALAQLEDLRVAARTSSFAFKGTSPDLAEVSTKLKVATVLEGSVRKAGDHLRITAQLIDASSGYHLWSERYDRKLEDVFAIQDDIATAIADKLQVTLAAGTRQPLVGPTTENLEAYDLYLRGRFLVTQGGESPRMGLEYFQRALATDPQYALAHAGVAEAYHWLGATGISRPRDVLPKARQAAMRALELDETLPEAHFQLGLLAWAYDFEWSKAEEHLLKALELNPDLPQVHSLYGFFLASMGRSEESLSSLLRGVQLDPLCQIAHTWFGQVLAWLRRFPEAIDRLRTALELNPTSWHANQILGMAYRLNADYSEAIEALETAITVAGRHPWSVMELGLTYLASGRTSQGEAIYDELSSRWSREYVPPTNLSFLSGALGRVDEAFQWLERAYDERDTLMTWVKLLPHFDPLRDDPRYSRVLEKMGLEA
ncbi:MAG: tetratricopeptide repeat protein [Gemmatimonadetes bacterium]|nr:tetratricopeptide repeat protein [Gemmatimonadota bacterium]